MKKNIRIIECEAEKKQLISKFANLVSKELVNELTAFSYANNSLLAMTKDWNLFVEFCNSKHVSPLPASSTALRLFIERESKLRKYSTIKRYVVTIGLFHRVLGLSDPSATSNVKLALGKTRLDKKGDAKSTVPFEIHHLNQLDEIFADSPHPRDIRNLAIYHVMFCSLAKRSELKNLQISDLVSSVDGKYSIRIGANTYPIDEFGSMSIERWAALRNANSNWLFTAIDKHGNVADQRLDDSSIFRIVRSASEKLGLTSQFSGQSLRVGAAKELAKQGIKVKDIQQIGRWMSAAMPYYYLGNKPLADTERMVFKTFKPIS
tara:strand:- start:465 stop:1424 length:960 start_codon:yes stop_codon:yes gene_type:complete